MNSITLRITFDRNFADEGHRQYTEHEFSKQVGDLLLGRRNQPKPVTWGMGSAQVVKVEPAEEAGSA